MVADPFMAYKPKEHTYKFPKGGISFFAFLLSIFIYICIFYIFNLSLSSLFNNNKFWFCISNTLILIIAADYGVFSPSKQKLDFHDRYEDYSLKQTQMKNLHVSSPLPSVNFEENPKKISIHEQEKEIDVSSPLASVNFEENPKKISIHEQEKEIVVDQERESPEEKLQIIIEGRDSISDPPSSSEKDIQLNKACEQREIPAKTYRRSKSEKGKRTVLVDESKSMVRRTETMKNEAKKEENEFSMMTDEELNRRVEEFIQRFNRQIRLQAAATKTNQKLENMSF